MTDPGRNLTLGHRNLFFTKNLSKFAFGSWNYHVLIFITNVYNCSQMLCKFRTKHLLTQNTPHFLSFRNILSIKVLQKTIQIQTKDNNKRPCHLHQITWQSAWGYHVIWCKQRCVLRQVTTHDERKCPPRTPKWNNSLCFPASFSLFGAATKC